MRLSLSEIEEILGDLSGGERLVLLEQAHDSLSEVGHVLADHEGEMASQDFLVVNDVVTDLVASPLAVFQVSQNVGSAREHRNWDSLDVLERDQVRLPLLFAMDQVGVVVCPNLEAVFLDILSVVQDRFDRRSIRLVAHIDRKSVIVIKGRIVGHEQRHEQLAKD